MSFDELLQIRKAHLQLPNCPGKNLFLVEMVHLVFISETSNDIMENTSIWTWIYSGHPPLLDVTTFLPDICIS